jgi:phosphonate transport system substrate-binding protein
MPLRQPRAVALGLVLVITAAAAPISFGGLLSRAQAQSKPTSTPSAKPMPAGSRVLRIGAIPDQKPEKLNRLYGQLADELSRQLGFKVRYVPVIDYAAAVTAFRTGDLDLVWFGGLTGVQARLQKPGARVLAQRDIDVQFHSVFIANARSGLKPVLNVKELTQLKGKRFTFGSESSTSGRLMPQVFLAKAGVKLTDFSGGGPGFSGSHDATIALVQSGAYDAGAVNEQVWKSSLRERKADRSKVIAIWRTPGYPDYHWIAQPDLDRRLGKGTTDRITAALVSLRRTNPSQAPILELFGAQQFVPASADQYATIEKVGREIGKIR